MRRRGGATGAFSTVYHCSLNGPDFGRSLRLIVIAYRIVPVTPFQQNCSVIWCEASRRGAIVDPGGDIDTILRAVEQEGITVEKILITHGHIDHAGATADLAERLSVPVEGPQREEKFWIDAMEQQGRMFGVGQGRPFEPDRWLNDGDSVQVGDDVRFIPGHGPMSSFGEERRFNPYVARPM